MVYIIVIEAILIIGLIVYLWRVKRSIRSIEEQMKGIGDTDTNGIIRNENGIKLLDRLINGMNSFIKKDREKVIVAQKQTINMKESIVDISHDLRTPLTTASGYTAMLKDMELTEEERRRYIDIIEERQGMVKNLVEQLFYYSRMESESIAWKEEELDLRKELINVLAMYYGDFERQKCEPEVELQEVKMPFVTDKDAVARIFSNIISNGLAHGQGGYRVVMEVVDGRKATDNGNAIDGRKATDNGNAIDGKKNSTDGYKYYRFEFSNLAVGMTKAEAASVFERYYTKDTVRSTGHAGLGMAIAKSLSERMHATISADLVDDRFSIEILFPVDS